MPQSSKMYGRWLRGYIRRSKAPYAVVLRAAKGVAIRFDQGWSQGSFVEAEAEAEVKAAMCLPEVQAACTHDCVL